MGGAVLVYLLVSVSPAAEQDPSGTIIGQVADATHAGIPSAVVRAISAATGKVMETNTDSGGYYSLAFLAAGSYRIEATSPGFKTLVKNSILLQTGDTLSVPLVIEVGDVSENVSVSADKDKLQTSTATRSYKWDAAKLKATPVVARQAYSLVSLTPGVLFTQEQFGTSSFANVHGFTNNSTFVINGGLPATNQFLLNGAPVSLTGRYQYMPTMDSIDEFKVLTNNYDSQFGRTGGGVVSTTLKSGSNAWHGSVFEYFHNAVFDANSTENNSAGLARGKHNTHQFGGAIGGPIRKDKDFLFANYEGFREISAYPIVSDTPTAAIRTGQNFSRYGIQIYDPQTAHSCKAGVDTPAGVSCFGSFIRNPFPGNVIPSSRISAIGQRILSLYPAPNARGVTQNYLALGNTNDSFSDQPVVRWDRVLGDKDRFSMIGAYSNGHEFQSNNGFPPPADTGNHINDTMDQNYIGEWTHVISASTVLDTRLSFGRYTRYFPDSSGAGNLTAAELGILNIPRPPTIQTDNPPSFNLENYSSIIGNTYNWYTQNQWDFQPSIIHSRGKHVLHAGAEVVYAAIGSAGPGRANGEFSFGRAWTDQYTVGPRNGKDGSSVADLLLGTPQIGFIDYNDSSYRTWPYWALYFQDTWRVAPHLTLTMGLRYDVQVPFAERFNRVNAGFDLSAKNPLSDQILAAWTQMKSAYDSSHTGARYPSVPAAIHGGRLFANSDSRRPYQTDWTDFQPRVGVAWNIAAKTVFHAGAGIFYRTAAQMNQSDGFSQRTNYINSLDGGVHPSAGLTGPYSLENPFPSGILASTGSSLGLRTNAGEPIVFDGTQRPIPRTYQYSAGIRRELPGKIVLDASYAGSQTVHDSMPAEYDSVSYSQFVRGASNPDFLNRLLPNPFFGILPSTSDLGSSPQISAYNLLSKYPLFNGVVETTNPWAKYRYDSLQVMAEKRVLDSATTGVFLFLLSYTFSKSMESSHRLNSWNLAEAPVHELSALDKPRVFALSGIWDLPIGWGRRWYNQGGRLSGALLNGWSTDWIATYSSGYPVSQPDAILTCPNYSATGGQTADHWFNNDPDCYEARPQYTLRTNPDRFTHIRNPAAPQLHASIEKTFWMTDKYSLQFRGEVFNLTNTSILGPPTTDFKDPRFGQLPVAQGNYPRYIQIAAKLIF
jgi:hypothetical protein